MTREELAGFLAKNQTVTAAQFDAEMNWTDLDATDARFVDCRFERAGLVNVILASADFTRCHFSQCRFARSDLRHARWHGCDLQLAVFERSDLYATLMEDCNLRGARFDHVDFSHAFSRKLVRTRAIFRRCNLELADLAGARMPDCELAFSRLREADLTGADLTGADLHESDLFQAMLDGARLAGADLRGAEISGLNVMALADFAGMRINQDQQHVLLAAMGVEVSAGPG